MLPLLVLCLAQEVRTFTSRSGVKTLEVKKDADEGYVWTLRSLNEVRWERMEYPSVKEAFVCDDGTVVAHGIALPEASWREQAFALIIMRNDENLRAFDLRLHELHPVVSMVSHVGPLPSVRGMFVWEKHDSCAFLIDDMAKPDQLWTYTLSTGARRGVIEPQSAIATVLGDDWRSYPMRGALAPGQNDLLIVTLLRQGKILGPPGPGNYVGPDLRGIAALFRADGDLLWWKELPDARFAGEIRALESTVTDLRCEIGVNRRELDGRRVNTIPVDLLALHFHRDDGGAWVLQ